MRKKQKDDNRPFLKRHPVINYILAFVFLGLVIVACYYAVVFMSRGIRIFIDWLASLTSKLDAVVVVALITGMLSLISVLVTKRIEFKKSRDDYLAKKREVPYGAFVNMVYRIIDNGKTPGSYSESQMKNDLMTFSKDITLWGSPRVARKWGKFRTNGTNPQKAMDNLYLIEEIMNEMRKDLGMRKIHKGELLSFFVNDLNSRAKK